MTERAPDRPEPRISDADRERVVQRLHEAVADGRLTLAEFEERVAGVLQARTASELEPYVADLPEPAGGARAAPEPAPRAPAPRDPAGGVPATPLPASTAPESAELRARVSKVERRGRWTVPRRLSVHSRAGSVMLDFTEAVVAHPVVELTLDVTAGSTTLVLPPGASVDVDRVEMVAGRIRVHDVPTSTEPTGTPHVVVTGSQRAGSLRVRPQHRFLWWRW